MAKLRSTDLNGNLFVSGQLKLQRPFLISTDELITNLNADRLDGKHADDLAISTQLGYYDTMTENSDGSYTITRQTGYISGKDCLSKTIYKNGANNPYIRFEDISINYIENIIGNCNRVDANWWNNTYSEVSISYDSTYNYLVIMLPNSETDTSSLNNISVQYKLTTSYTEKVEKNHYARYNERFILEHNKSEAERSANVWNEDLELGQFDWTTGEPAANDTRFRSKSFSRMKPSTSYFISSPNNIEILFYDSAGNYIYNISRSNTSFVTPNNTYYFKICNSLSNVYNNDIMINEGTKPLPYQPYNQNKHITNNEAEFLKIEYDRSSNLLTDNVFADEKQKKYVTYTANGSIITINSTNADDPYLYFKNCFTLDKETTITLSLDNYNNIQMCGIVNNETTTFIAQATKPITLTLSAGTYGLGFETYDVGSNTYKVMLNEGAEPLPYQPYEGKVVHEKELENYVNNKHNLGYYDTISDNTDGTYTITRQTGYLKLDGVGNKFDYKMGSTINAEYAYTGATSYVYKPTDLNIKPDIISDDFETMSANALYSANVRGISLDSSGTILVGLTTSVSTLEAANAYLMQNPISIQYKLATSYTEKVEANHYARYNQKFILEHNKSEAERSANLFDINTVIIGNGYDYTATATDWVKAIDIPVEPNTTYTASYPIARYAFNHGNIVADYNKNTITTSNDTTTLSLFMYVGDYSGTVNAWFSNYMLNEGSVALPYQPYEGKVVHEKDLDNKFGTFVTTDTPQTISSSKTFSGNQIFTGYLDIRGTAAEKHLKTRGIGGSDGNGNEAELYLQYNSSYATKFGRSGDGSLNSDGTITEAGELLSDKYAAKSHTHTKSQVGLGNVDNTADANKSVKYATTAGTANSVPEANLTWGGKNFSGSYGPIDAAMVSSLGANRLAFVPAAGVTVEYSRDGGSTWTDYGLNDTQKTAMFSGPQTSTGAVIGKPSRNSSTKKYENVSVNNRLRVTLKSDAAHVYTALNKFVIYCSTSGSTGCKCTIQGLTKNNYDAGNNSWTTFADGVDISGWSGFNVINTSSIITYSNNSSQYIQIRFTFYCGGNSSMETYGGLSIINIYGFGGVGWTTPSNMAKWGQLYSYDAGQNVFFPANVAAKTISVDTINGQTLGNAIVRQNTSTGEVILGSTVRPLRLWGNGDRPTYSKDDGVSYKNLALLSDLNGYLPLSGGSLTGELKLYAASGDSPRLTFQRGTLTDTYNDWSIYDSGGYLYVQQRGSGSTAWETRGTFYTYGADFAGTIYENGTSLADKYAAKSHTHTKSEVGLGNVDNTADANKSVKYATSAGTATNLVSFTHGYHRPVANGGDGKQWMRIANIVDNDIANGSRWYGKAVDIEFYNSGYGSNGGYVYMGHVSICVSVQNHGTFANESVTIKWRDCKPNIWSPDHIKAVKNTNNVEIFMLNDIWDTAIIGVIVRNQGIDVAASNTLYTQTEFSNYISGKATATGVLDTNVIVGKADYANSAGSANSVAWGNVSGRPSSLPASDVYAWAKASTKPSYTKSEVGLGNVDNTADANKNVNYATSAGNADTVDGDHSSAFARVASHNNLMASTDEFTFASSGFAGAVWLNYRTAGGTNGNITEYKLGNGAGKALGSIIHTGNIGSQSVNYATTSHLLRTYSASDTSHGGDYYLKCRHNVDGNERFKLQIIRSDGSVTHSTSVDYANSAGSVDALNSLGRISCLSGASRYDSGLRMHQVYSNGYPFSYGSSITIENGFGAEIIFNGLGGGGNTDSGEMQFRTHSDWDTSEWGSWRTVIDSSNIGSQNVNYANSAGSANSVAWGNVSGRPSSLPASDVYSWAKASTKPTYTKSEVGLGNVDNTADANKSVNYANSAGSANSVAWGNVTGKPSEFTPASHTHPADTSLSSTSYNTVQNQVIYSAFSGTVGFDSKYYAYGENGSWRLRQYHATGNSLDIRYGKININAQEKTYSVSFGENKSFTNTNYTIVFGIHRSDRHSWFWSPLVTVRGEKGFTVYVRGNTSGDNSGTLMYIAIRSN